MSTLHLELAPGELALARAAAYRYASELFRHPNARWERECAAWADGVKTAVALCAEPEGRGDVVERLDELMATPVRLDDVVREHADVFGHVTRGRVTACETEWSGAAGSFLQFHLLSDVSAFYAAFGVELADACDERADHLSIELAFLHLLCVKEAWAIEAGTDEQLEIVRDAQATFLREHLARWTPAFCARLARAGGPFYARIARWLETWIALECRRLGVAPGEPSLELVETTFTEEDACMSCAQSAGCLARAAVPNERLCPNPD